MRVDRLELRLGPLADELAIIPVNISRSRLPPIENVFTYHFDHGEAYLRVSFAILREYDHWLNVTERSPGGDLAEDDAFDTGSEHPRGDCSDVENEPPPKEFHVVERTDGNWLQQ